MKTKILVSAMFFFIAATFMTSCGEKTGNNSKKLQDDMKETNQQIKENVQETSADIKAKVSADWERFKASSNEVLENTEKEIKELRVKVDKADKTQRAKLNQNLDDLEQKNKELKEKIASRTTKFKEDMVEFNEKAKDNQKVVERELKHDIDELGKSIKNFFEKNTD